MARSSSHLETEIKLRLATVPTVRRTLRRVGFRVRDRRIFEVNTIFDTVGGDLRRNNNLLRLRLAGPCHTLTFKGPPHPGRYKTRHEIESEVTDPKALTQILAGLGYAPVFRYEKYRTVYSNPGRPGLAMLDETPVGAFLELEGSPPSIDRMARELGYSPADYITASYGRLYLDHCESAGVSPRNMVFSDCK